MTALAARLRETWPENADGAVEDTVTIASRVSTPEAGHGLACDGGHKAHGIQAGSIDLGLASTKY